MNILDRLRGNSSVEYLGTTTAYPAIQVAGVVPVLLACITMATLLSFMSPVQSQSLDYVTPNKSLEGLERSMTSYYLELESSHKLPVQRVTDDLGMLPKDLIYGLGLLRGRWEKPQFPIELTKLLQRLNPTLWRRRQDGSVQWVNRKGDTFCLPAVVWVNALTLVRIKVPSAIDPVAAIDSRLGTCELLGADCREKLELLVRSPDANGTIAVAALAQGALSQDSDGPTSCAEAQETTVTVKLSSMGIATDKSQHLRPADGSETYRINANKSLTLAHPVTSAAHNRAGVPRPLAPVKIEFGKIVADATVAASDAMDAEMEATSDAANAAMEAASDAMDKAGDANDGATDAAAVPITTEPVDFVPNPKDVAPGAVSMLVANFYNTALREAGLAKSRLPSSGARKVGVLLFDTAIVGCHFVLRQALSQCMPVLNAPAPESFWLLPRPSKADHGAHVGGLIAGGFGIGVYPGAPIHPIELLSGAGVTVFDQDMEQKVSNAIFESGKGSRVANFSVNLNARDHNVSRRLADGLAGDGSVLVVAAAGDTSGPLDHDCDVLPACLSLGDSDNLAVVGGVQRSEAGWQLWPQSSYGQKVHLLAPALGVVSAVTINGWLGSMNGTSQSAAIVSGIAARLFATKPPAASAWSPAQVRNRLMATSQITSDTLSWSKSGVVDGDRALDTGTQVLRYSAATGEEELRGRIIDIVNPVTGERAGNDIEMMLVDGTKENFSYCRMYRISRIGPNNTWVFAYQPWGDIQNAARWAKMDIHGSATLSTFSKSLLFQSSDKVEPIRVPIGDVLDFYDEFSGRFACSEPKPKSE